MTQIQPLFPIYLLRHGETAWNVEKRLQGSMNSPLTPLGIRQAIAMGDTLGRRLDYTQGWQLVSSPLERATQTASIIAGQCRLHMTVDSNLREISLGSWNGMTWEQIEHAHPGASTRRGRDFHSLDGESYEQVAERAGKWLMGVNGPTIAISHGIIGQVVRGLYLGDTDIRSQPYHSSQEGLYLLDNGEVEFIPCQS